MVSPLLLAHAPTLAVGSSGTALREGAVESRREAPAPKAEAGVLVLGMLDFLGGTAVIRMTEG
jgi:hypothetical protein